MVDHRGPGYRPPYCQAGLAMARTYVPVMIISMIYGARNGGF